MERGKAEVSVDWMKDEWKKRGLKERIQLTVTRSLGPCDLSNVANINCSAGAVWYGTLRDSSQYLALLEWAATRAEAGELAPLPEVLGMLRFDPFRKADSIASREKANHASEYRSEQRKRGTRMNAVVV
jgi:hypothetical protein